MDAKHWKNLFFMVGSMVLFFTALCLLLPWKIAALASGGLFFHEYGHIWAMQRYGMKVKGMYFIPFLGGAAVPASRMPSTESDVVISLMGPIFGLVLAAVTAVAYGVTGWTELGVGLVFMGLINLFNLIPVYPLDGGRVLSCIAHSVDQTMGTFLMGGSVALVAVLILSVGFNLVIVFVGFLAVQALMAYIGRPQRQELCTKLEVIAEEMDDGRYTKTGDRAMVASILGFPDMAWAYLQRDKNSIPVWPELLLRLEVTIANLREHPPLSVRGIVTSILGWAAVVSGFLALGTWALLDHAVVEGFVQLFRR